MNGKKMSLILTIVSCLAAVSVMGVGQVVELHVLMKGQNPKERFASYYQPAETKVEPKIPAYELPLTLEQVVNFDKLKMAFSLQEKAADMLRQNGLVVMEFGRQDNVVRFYDDLKARNVPLLVTVDSLLHLYHILFQETLKELEEELFYHDVLAMSRAMVRQSMRQHEVLTGDVKEAARRNLAFFFVGWRLLGPDARTPEGVRREVSRELRNIKAHQGFSESAIFNYREDYSQYVPRGHYTRSEKLRRYFKAMMWYGRMTFLLKGGPAGDGLVSEKESRIQTLQAALIAAFVDKVKVEGGTQGKEVTVAELWERLYTVTSFFVGFADDLTIYEYRESLRLVFGEQMKLEELEASEKMFSLKKELAKKRSPEIYGGTGDVAVWPDEWTTETLNKILEKTKGMRFMGQRYIPDSYMMGQLVFPKIGPAEFEVEKVKPFTLVIAQGGAIRGYPRGLDVMAVLGSKRAEEILNTAKDSEYEKYDEQLGKLTEKFASFDGQEWNRNLYWSWLYALKALLQDYGKGYQSFMQTRAYVDKQLNTALASWTELRHDTILYAKQSYTARLVSIPPPPKAIVGYVEPVVELYGRLLVLTQMTSRGLDDLEVLTPKTRNRLRELENALQRLLDISRRELENQVLSDGDYEFIGEFAKALDGVIGEVDDKGKETTIVADVHTESNEGRVLEEGVGYLDLMLAAYRAPDGSLIVGAGPVLSHYEFKHPMSDRLTDEKWKELLQGGKAPERAEWIKSFWSSSNR